MNFSIEHSIVCEKKIKIEILWIVTIKAKKQYVSQKIWKLKQYETT
jgi:hypothetical protein